MGSGLIWYLFFRVSPLQTVKVHIADRIFIVEVAETQSERMKGLAGHSPIASDEGMLFVFEQPDKYCFWMKGVDFPLDIVWFDSDKQLISAEKNVQPESYPSNYCPERPAKYVLELQGGIFSTINLDKDKQLGVEDL